METHLSILNVFLGEEALICIQYEGFINALRPLYQAIEILIFNDSKFPAQLYYRIDAILGEVISQLFIADDITEVPFEDLVEFGQFIREIKFKSFKSVDRSGFENFKIQIRKPMLAEERKLP